MIIRTIRKSKKIESLDLRIEKLSQEINELRAEKKKEKLLLQQIEELLFPEPIQESTTTIEETGFADRIFAGSIGGQAIVANSSEELIRKIKDFRDSMR